MDLNSLIVLGCFSVSSIYLLLWPAKHLWDDVNDFKRKGEYKDALSSLQEQSVKDATA